MAVVIKQEWIWINYPITIKTGLDIFPWSVDIDKDGKNELVFILYHKSLYEDEIIWHVLTDEGCKEKLQQKDFTPEKDKVTLAYDSTRSYGIPITPPILAKYNNETIILDFKDYKETMRPQFDAYGIMNIYTFYAFDFEKPKKTFPDNFSHKCHINFFTKHTILLL
ncbi:MAG: hypothetical protein LBB59_09045 [Campylobacteraceae bacterium]|nr:hypothetical protein [Campylobacteraceae bacterium]